MKPQKPLDLAKIARRERLGFTAAAAVLLLAAVASIVLSAIGVNP